MPDPFALVLGVAQDGGHPQPGCRLACCRDVTMPRMAAFLAENGPWRQLVELGNVRLVVGEEARLGDRLVATAIRVPHRDEYAETVAWRTTPSDGPGADATVPPPSRRPG